MTTSECMMEYSLWPVGPSAKSNETMAILVIELRGFRRGAQAKYFDVSGRSYIGPRREYSHGARRLRSCWTQARTRTHAESRGRRRKEEGWMIAWTHETEREVKGEGGGWASSTLQERRKVGQAAGPENKMGQAQRKKAKRKKFNPKRKSRKRKNF